MLDAQVDRQLHGREVGGKAGRLKVGEALVVDIFLHAGNALVVDIGQPDDVGGRDAGGVEPALLGAEPDAGNAELHDLALLARGELAPEPHEARAAGQPVVGLLVVDIRKDGREFFDRLVGIDDPARFAEQRGGLDVGREHLAVAVDDVRP